MPTNEQVYIDARNDAIIEALENTAQDKYGKSWEELNYVQRNYVRKICNGEVGI